MGWFSFFHRKQATPIDSSPAVFGGILVWSFCFEPHFGLSKADLRALAAPLLETIRGLANFWTVVYLCWVYRTGLRAKYGDDFFEAAFQSAYARLARSGETATYGDDLRFWFKTLDKAGNLVQAPEIPMEYFAALAFLGLSPDSPFFGRSDFVGYGIELELAEVLKKAKTSALPQIEMLVHGRQDDPAFESQWRKLRHSFESEGSQLLK